MRPTVGLEGALAGLTISLPALLFISFTLNLQLLPHLPCASSCSGSCACTYFFTYCSCTFPQVGPGLGRHARQEGHGDEAAASTGRVSCSIDLSNLTVVGLYTSNGFVTTVRFIK